MNLLEARNSDEQYCDSSVFLELIEWLEANIKPEYHSLIQKNILQSLQACQMASVYPHVDNNVVKIGALLLPFIENDYLTCKKDMEVILDLLKDMELEQRLRIIDVLFQSKTGFPTGEAKIVQYYYH
ncbi:hypothetical protein [Desulforamulus aquiferis]|uniref:Uncharacterized protein n=1 Tax=Desulforamulus aquiferis TaxID=1397668 RepID=A0AAW7ZE55_9FIRM|nr:hypothetical protein [Desulforamulus aquiferis]MDO7787080.1 hypothetical protein [Desulforamulus aquiferis]RYD06617.1 hypothetical protein N752_02810 [Desulforamulus aquiferis]